MDGVTETEIVLTMGTKFGSVAGGKIDLSNVHSDFPSTVMDGDLEVHLPDEPTFHFPICRRGAKRQMNLDTHEHESNKVPHPLDLNRVDPEAANINRKKGWCEKITDMYSAKHNRKDGITQEEIDVAQPLERPPRVPYQSLDSYFDGAALVATLGKDSGAKRRQTNRPQRPKIGSQKTQIKKDRPVQAHKTLWVEQLCSEDPV
ncbi:hypothetical protein R1sor_026724 [Riccia sorocarpa]|uniref:Uncharacterized protein n=1 Tax=Riccia sorocarpa TaxID=122646 RepID=A0ABD3GDP6_9MARC